MRHHRRRENFFACLRSTTSNCWLSYFKIPRSYSLVFMLQLFALLRRIAEPIPSLPPSFTPPEISLFWETSIAITPSGTQKVVPTPVGRKHSIGSSLLSSFLSITLTYLLFLASLTVATPLISSLLLPLSLSCSWEVFQNLGFDHLPFLLTIPLSLLFRPNERLPSFNF